MHFILFHLNSEEKNKIFPIPFTSFFVYFLLRYNSVLLLYKTWKNMYFQDREKEGQRQESFFIVCLLMEQVCSLTPGFFRTTSERDGGTVPVRG